MGRHLSNLPAEVTSFVGRRQELREVKRLLTTTRLLTLTGSGGAGKTKLALRAAAEMSRGFPDGAWLVLLDSVRDPLLVTQAVFGALGVHDLSSGLSLSSLTDYLAGKRLLLVLDNCEHLLDACAVLASTLLAACPDLHVLATSRQALGVAGEVRMVVPPMSLPARGGGHVGPAAARLRRGVAAERAGRRGRARLHRRRGQRRAGPGPVPEAGRHPAGAGTGRGPPGLAQPGAAEPRAWPASCRSWARRTAAPRPASRRWRRPSAGATACSTSRNSCCGPGCRCSPAGSRKTRRPRSAPIRGSRPGGSPACSGRWWTSPS